VKKPIATADRPSNGRGVSRAFFDQNEAEKIGPLWDLTGALRAGPNGAPANRKKRISKDIRVHSIATLRKYWILFDRED
jgi:hypothetical protein